MSKVQIVSVFLFGSPLLFPEQNNDLFFREIFLDFPHSILEFSPGLSRHNLEFHHLHP